MLDVLELRDQFDFVASRDDVENGKPDPEIYDLVAGELNVAPENTLVLEDSPSGVQAALNANMHVIAVGTPFTKAHLLEMDSLDNKWVVTDPAGVAQIIEQKIEEVNSN